MENRAKECYLLGMTKARLKKEPTGKWVVRDSRDGRFIEVRGADSMKGANLVIKKGVDLTKPIAKQALKGSRIRRSPRGGSSKSENPAEG